MEEIWKQVHAFTWQQKGKQSQTLHYVPK